MMIFEPHKSELTDKISYDQTSEEMWIHFLDTDTIWRYYNISYDVFFELVSAASVGEYFNDNVRNNFNCDRVNDMPQ